MQAAQDRIRAGDLEGALTLLQGEVRKTPANPGLRVFLFQLLVVLGQWERARNQLTVLADMDQTSSSLVRTYGPLLLCEGQRQRVFEGKEAPIVFGKPQPWMALLARALHELAEGKLVEAGALRDRAFAEAPAIPGRVVGQPFAWLADADTRLGPMLEAVINGRYLWIPFCRLRAVRVEAPTDLRDFVWAPASLTLSNGGEVVAFIPTRYPGSEASPDNGLRLARRTEWQDREPGHAFGLGQRTFATDTQEVSLLEAREIELDSPAEGPEAVTGPAASAPTA